MLSLSSWKEEVERAGAPLPSSWDCRKGRAQKRSDSACRQSANPKFCFNLTFCFHILARL